MPAMTRWWLAAACRDHPHPDWWTSQSVRDIARARQVCAVCPVVDECRAESADECYGVWAGVPLHYGKAGMRKLHRYESRQERRQDR